MRSRPASHTVSVPVPLFSSSGSTLQTLKWTLTIAVVSLAALACDPQVRPGGTREQGHTVELIPSDSSTIVLGDSLRLGTVDVQDEYIFASVGDVVIAPNGDIFVFDGIMSHVLRFDKRGRLLGSIGRSGQGPGEFQRPKGLALATDTLFVLAGVYLHAFTHGGEVLYAERIDEYRSGLTPLHDIAWTPDGLLGFRRTHSDSVSDGEEYTDSIIVELRTPTSGELLPTTIALPGRTSHRRGELYVIELFDGMGEYAVGLNGKLIYSHGDEYVLDILEPDGDRIRRVRGAVDLKPVDRSDHREFIRRAVDSHISFPGAPAAPTVGLMESVPHSPHRAPLGRILAGRDGRALVERPDLAARHPIIPNPDETIWDLVDLEGSFVGRLTLPAWWKPMAYSDMALYVHDPTALTPTLVRYQLFTSPE